MQQQELEFLMFLLDKLAATEEGKLHATEIGVVQMVVDNLQEE